MSCPLIALLLGLSLLFSANAAKFSELYEPSWALDHVIYDGELLQLKLDNVSGTLLTELFSISIAHNIALRPI